MSAKTLEFVSDEKGTVTAVLVPIELWREISSQIETGHLASSATMTRRLQQALADAQPASFDEVLQKLGITRDELE